MPPKHAFIPKKACDICYAKKTTCSLPNPEGPCERCAHRSLECTFNREKPSKKRKTSKASSDVQILSQRIKQLENALVRAGPRKRSTPDLANPEEPQITASSQVKSRGISTSPSGRERFALSDSSPSSLVFTPPAINTYHYATADHDAGINVSANQLGPNWFFNGMAIFSEEGRQWLSRRTDQDIKWAEFCIPVDFSSFSAFPQECDLPDQDATRETMSVFFRSSFKLTFPVLDEVLFETSMQAAYKPVNPHLISPTQAAARACVLGALSIATRLNATKQSNYSIDADLCSSKADSLLTHLYGDISLDTLQAILLLQIQRTFSGKWQGASFLNSMACRIVCSLRGHIYKPPTLCEISHSERESHQTRTLFWLCYMLDKDIALRTGNPPLLTEDYCDLTAPVNSLHYYTYLPALDDFFEMTNKTHEIITPHLPGDTRLSHLKEKVCRNLFSAQALKDNDDQLLLHIRKLDDEIERWRLSVPTGFRPALFVSQNSLSNSPEEGIPHVIRRMSLQLDYHHLMTVVHTTVRKCTPDAADETEDLHAVVHSSFDLSLVASRSTLACLKALVGTIAEQAFRFFTSYFTTAAMSLFLDIVIHPFNPQAQLDLELLMSAANTMRSLATCKLTQSEVARVQEESKFVLRLVWLGTCAMTTADRAKKTGSF
ncbi:hypothetical protein N7508_010359 [Penicillium antarcticum]|uniref:uncharacterized protein n=1 Tax=Penicillium antarcticum TaxID=416450 RepID=UPI0023A027C8|nr:uncharacterized protein N7508_010359 [Penicillium antarcticum]KAJ5295538.1 hypothetical protein N7508_010359 [Penicillium antarcticum]